LKPKKKWVALALDLSLPLSSLSSVSSLSSQRWMIPLPLPCGVDNWKPL
jgi:hypothetical protein